MLVIETGKTITKIGIVAVKRPFGCKTARHGTARHVDRQQTYKRNLKLKKMEVLYIKESTQQTRKNKTH